MTEFAPLLEIATPDVYRRNAFRVTGQSVDVNSRELERHAEKARMRERLGMPSEPIGGPLPLDPPPDAEGIREATLRLRDPEKRLAEEFFWFWPMTPGRSASDEALQALSEGRPRAAVKEWRKHAYVNPDALSQEVLPDGVETHNLAVLWHAITLEWDLDLEDEEENTSYWQLAHQAWATVVDGWSLWEDFRDRVEAKEEARLTSETVDRLAATLAQAIVRIGLQQVVRIARRACESNPPDDDLLDLASRWLDVVAEFAARTLAGDAYEDEARRATESARAELHVACDSAHGEIERSPASAAETARGLAVRASELLPVIQSVYEDGHALVEAASDAVATTVVQCAIAIANQTKKSKEALEILDIARPFAQGAEAKDSVDRNVAIAKDNLAFEQITAIEDLLESVGRTNLPPVQRFDWLRDQLLPWLEKFEKTNSAAPKAVAYARNLLSAQFRSVSVDIHNARGDVARVAAAFSIAVRLCSDRNLATRLYEDEQTLSGIYGQHFRVLGSTMETPGSKGVPASRMVSTYPGNATGTVRQQPTSILERPLTPTQSVVAVLSVIGALAFGGFLISDGNSSAPRSSPVPPVSTAIPTPTPFFLPPVPEATRPPMARLKNGRVLRRFRAEGLGALEVDNGTAWDAKVVLAEVGASSSRGAMYVRAGSKATMKGIPEGTYRLAFEFGEGWNKRTGGFDVSHGAEVFAESATFVETERYDNAGDLWRKGTGFTITLHKTSSGNAQTVPADPSLLAIGGTE